MNLQDFESGYLKPGGNTAL